MPIEITSDHTLIPVYRVPTTTDDHELGWSSDPATSGSSAVRALETMVELMTRYSNNPTVLDELRHAREAVLSPDEDDDPGLGGERRASGSRNSAVADRLAAGGIQAVVDGYRAGSTTRELAERFKISTSSVKRLVRRAAPPVPGRGCC